MTITTVYTKNLTDPIPDNSSGAFDYGWVGQHQRPLEHATGLQPVIEMGARPYNPILGRFLRLDPIPGGATDSDYAYVNDPINTYDLSGELLGIKCGWCKDAANAVKSGAKSVAKKVAKHKVGLLQIGAVALFAVAAVATVSTGGLALGGLAAYSSYMTAGGIAMNAAAAYYDGPRKGATDRALASAVQDSFIGLAGGGLAKAAGVPAAARWMLNAAAGTASALKPVAKWWSGAGSWSLG